ncbi:hypothetical protein PYCC9005_003009 [Savitreella phatthalungensis]
MRLTILAALCSPVALAAQATLYMFPDDGHRHDSPPTLTPAESRQIYSEIFRVSRYHRLGFIGQQSRVIDLISGNDYAHVFQPSVGSVVLNIAGVGDSKHIFPDTKPLCHIDNSPRTEAYSDLMVKLLNQAEDLRGERLEKVYGNSRRGGLYLSPPLKTVHEHVRHGPSMDRFEKFYGKAIAQHFDMRIVEDRGFISELSALESFVDAIGRAPAPSLDSQYAAGHLVGLEVLINKYGAHSDQYSAAVKAYHQTLSTLYSRMVEVSGTQQRLIVALLPPIHEASTTGPLHGGILKRWEENEMLFGDQHVAPTLELTRSSDGRGAGGCYKSQAACEEATDKCSGHGTCKKYMGQENCYQCMCSPTVRNVTGSGGSGKKTTVWAGDACNKRDVSVEFQIFFWFTIMAIATLIWAIKLLASVQIDGGILAATGYINKSVSSRNE